VLQFYPANKNSKSWTDISAFSRFGATVISHQGLIYVIGGVGKDKLLSLRDEIFSFLLQADMSVADTKKVMLQLKVSVPRPLLIGLSAVSTGESILIMGGSAVCFSFGTSWNKGVYLVQTPDTINTSSVECWNYTHTVGSSSFPSRPTALAVSTSNKPFELIQVRRVRLDEFCDFQSVLQTGRPVVLEGLELGSCVSEWTLQGLKTKIGSSREVS
jgi:tRNA wybutosine-synthesizing protein 4